MILAGGSVRVIILEHPETCSFVQFSIKAFGLCPWTCHFSNPGVLPVVLRLGGSERCVRSGSPWEELCLYQNVFVALPGGLWLRADGMSHCVTPLNLTGSLSLLNCWQGGPVGNASSWLAQWPTGGHGGVPADPGNTQGQSQGSAARLGCAYPDPDPGTQRQEFGFALVFTPILLIQTGFAHPETPGLGRARAALLPVVQQKVLHLVWLWQMAQTWLACLGQWVQTGFNIPWKSELLTPLLEKGGRKRQIQFYSIHNFNNKMLLYTALVLLHYSHPLPPEAGSWNII